MAQLFWLILAGLFYFPVVFVPFVFRFESSVGLGTFLLTSLIYWGILICLKGDSGGTPTNWYPR